MEININFTTGRILEHIYALAAMHSYISQDHAAIPLLSRDQRRGLRAVMSESFGLILVRLGRHVTDCRLPDAMSDRDETFGCTLQAEDRFNASHTATVAKALETAIVMHLFSLIFDGFDAKLSADYERKSETAADNIATLLAPPAAICRITPYG